MKFRKATEAEIRKVFTHDEIWPKITEKGLSKENFDIKPGDYFTVTGDEILYLDDYRSIHPNFLPSVRGSFFFVVRQWVNFLLEENRQIYAVIHRKEKRLIRFCLMLGFDLVENIRGYNLFVKTRC